MAISAHCDSSLILDILFTHLFSLIDVCFLMRIIMTDKKSVVKKQIEDCGKEGEMIKGRKE